MKARQEDSCQDSKHKSRSKYNVRLKMRGAVYKQFTVHSSCFINPDERTVTDNQTIFNLDNRQQPVTATILRITIRIATYYNDNNNNNINSLPIPEYEGVRASSGNYAVSRSRLFGIITLLLASVLHLPAGTHVLFLYVELVVDEVAAVEVGLLVVDMVVIVMADVVGMVVVVCGD
eukprot:gene6508-7499_t